MPMLRMGKVKLILLKAAFSKLGPSRCSPVVSVACPEVNETARSPDPTVFPRLGWQAADPDGEEEAAP